MYIKHIKLQNYRNFEYLDLDLGRKTTVLIGKNGAGKTNLISALKQSLSFIFSSNSNICQKNFIADSMQRIKSFATTDAFRKINPDGTQSQIGSWPVSIETSIDIDEESPLNVRFERENLNQGIRESYSAASIHYWERYCDLQDLPVLAFYSDSFPHERATIGKKIQDLLNSEFGISQPAGYYNWDDPRDCCNVWQQFFSMQWKNFKYGHCRNQEEEYLAAICACMIQFSRPLENAEENVDFELEDITVVARGKNEILVLRFKNGMESDFETLPAGYRRAFSMVFDLANRAFLLNNHCDPEGIAFIDEIDLHLHPSLAQEILERMQRTFQRMQFIISTHSPLVLTNFRQNSEDCILYSLQRENNFSTSLQRIDHSFGIDYNSLLVNLMGTKVRNSLLRQLIDSYLYWRTADENELAKKAMDGIIDMVGPNSRIVEQLQSRS